MKAALFLFALVALVAAVHGQAAAAKPAAAPKAAADRFCHQSCYSEVDCAKALAAKKQLLDKSKIPYTIDAKACNAKALGCSAIVRYSFATQAQHDAYQALEKKDPAYVAIYKRAGLKSAAPKGLLKEGACKELKGF